MGSSDETSAEAQLLEGLVSSADLRNAQVDVALGKLPVPPTSTTSTESVKMTYTRSEFNAESDIIAKYQTDYGMVEALKGKVITAKAHALLNKQIAIWGTHPGYDGYHNVLPLADLLSGKGLVKIQRDQIVALALRDDKGDTLIWAHSLVAK